MMWIRSLRTWIITARSLSLPLSLPLGSLQNTMPSESIPNIWYLRREMKTAIGIQQQYRHPIGSGINRSIGRWRYGPAASAMRSVNAAASVFTTSFSRFSE